MKIINLTPHALNIQKADMSMIHVVPSGTVARCAETRAERPVLEVDAALATLAAP